MKIFLFQTIQFSVSTISMSNTDLFQEIQFSISTQFSSTWPIDRMLSGATTPRQSGPGSGGNERVLCIPQSSRITGTSPSDCLVLYLGHLWGPYCCGAVGLFNSLSRLGHRIFVGGVLTLYRSAVGLFYSPSWLDPKTKNWLKSADIWDLKLKIFKDKQLLRTSWYL